MEENPMTSVIKSEAAPLSPSNSDIDPQTTDDSPEDSSWTFYMQDFLCGNNDTVNSFSGSGCDDQAVADAFSSSGAMAAAAAAAALTAARSNGRQLSFKRRKPNLGASVSSDQDHDLEDTASSPAHSPKVSHINPLNLNRNDKDNSNVYDSEGNIGGRNNEAVSIEEEDDQNKQEESELKKKGLCLVPISMLRNMI